MADWTVLFLDDRVKDEYSSLPKDIQARFQKTPLKELALSLERLKEASL